jgi:hypothetical protein
VALVAELAFRPGTHKFWGASAPKKQDGDLFRTYLVVRVNQKR